MCGVWVAFEDTDEDNGPLFYYPGSHKLPELSGYDLGFSVNDDFYPAYEGVLHNLMTELGYKAVEFHARKGDLLVWASNLVHGGRPVRDGGTTRWSQVTHYMFEDCIYYQPHSSEIPTGEYRMLDIIDSTPSTPSPRAITGCPSRSFPWAILGLASGLARRRPGLPRGRLRPSPPEPSSPPSRADPSERPASPTTWCGW